ncbi:MAG TPA: hypothetical protein DCF68_16705, partial [Cyanothece sp. UBA12306]|nr:hypothetical protein [Cyanothece sp. UBA12306]
MTTNSPQKTTTYNFDKEDFAFLSLREYEETWSSLGLEDLNEKESDGLIKLFNASGIANSDDFDPTKVLLVKSACNILSAVYGPAIFRDGEKIILKSGDNQTIITQEGDRLTVGELKGKINVTEVEDGKGGKYPKVDASLISSDRAVFKIRVILNNEQNWSAGDIESMIINEESLLPYLAPVPIPAMKMQDLGVGEYEVKAISSSEGEYGLSFKLHLSGGQTVWVRGNSDILLQAGYQKKPHVPLTHIPHF